MVTSLLLALSPAAQAARITQTEETEALWRSKVDPWILDSVSRFGESDFLILLERQADLSTAAELTSKDARSRFVMERLQRVAAKTQPEILRQLDHEGADYRSFWVANMVWTEGDLDLIAALASREDVSHLYANPRVELDRPSSGAEFRSMTAQTVEPSIVLLATGQPFPHRQRKKIRLRPA